MRFILCMLMLLWGCAALQAQQKWRLAELGIQSGIGMISKKMSSTGWAMHWDAMLQKQQHLVGAEYETTTNMRINGNRFAVDQINVLYGRNVLAEDSKLRLAAMVGTGFYRQSHKPINSEAKYQSETAMGLKFKLKASYPLHKHWHVSANPNLSFNLSNTYFSMLAGICYRFF